jgi:DNA-binding transcriptional MerR regulator
MKQATFKIGELAKEAGVPVSTVRYYEREGILKPAARSGSNYRLYGTDDLDRLRFIRAAQATGFALADITELLRPSACGRVQRLIDERLVSVDERLRELRHVKRVLGRALAECQAHEPTGRCRVIDDLTARSRSSRRG